MKTESRIQQDCFMWLNNTYPSLRGLYFEIHNNAFSAKSGMKHKAIGRIPGVADNCLLVPDGGGAVFFEFKAEKGKQSEVQREWQRLVNKNGYGYFVVRTQCDFEWIVNMIMNE